jgi:nucleotide-binding universal stress UspA family protein
MGSPVFVGIQRILVAFDASPHAEHALDVALSMAGDMKAKLFVISIIRPPEPAESAEFHAVLEDGRERFEKCFIPLRERAKQKDIELETDIVVGIRRSRSSTRRTQSRPVSLSWASAATRFFIAGCWARTRSAF